jgi:hypothetical protein
MGTYLDAMLDTRQKLAEFGCSISDDTFIRAIAGSVPTAYHDAITQLEAALNAENKAQEAHANALNTAMANVTGYQPIAFTTRSLSASEVVNALRSKATTALAISNSSKPATLKTESVNSVQDRGGGTSRTW